MRNHLVFAALLVVEGAVVGSGLGAVALLAGAALLTIYFANRKKHRETLILAAIYVLVGIASFAVIQINWRIAEARSKPVIAACKQFHSKYRRYPDALNELVPEFISAVPHAGYTLISRRFYYFPSRPAIEFAVMFHGVASYDLQTNKWLTNE
jgi:hypothetical protein